MGISRDSRHKHRATGGRHPPYRKKRKFEMGRPPANTKLGLKKVRPVRCRGGNMKYRALRLDSGNFSWGSENISRKCRVLDVVYNASNNELVRTKTLVKNCIVQMDASPFKLWYRTRYGVELGKKKLRQQGEESQPVKQSRGLVNRKAARAARQKLDSLLEEQFNSGRLLACISSRPGQCGRCDGYVLEGDELQFYKRKMEKKKHK